MYHIAICDDQKVFSDTMEKECIHIFNKFKILFKITTFQSGDEFLKCFQSESHQFDLLLLDIMMQGINGMELAKAIREINNDITIVFITAHDTFALQGYNVQALHYLLKPVDSTVLENLLIKNYRQRFQKLYLVLESRLEITRIPVKDIVYMETVGRSIAIYLFEKTIFHTGKLTDLIKQLPEDMILRCHHSFALNIKNVRELNKQNAIATDGKIIPVSRRYMKEVQMLFLRSMGEKGFY